MNTEMEEQRSMLRYKICLYVPRLAKRRYETVFHCPDTLEPGKSRTDGS